MDLSKAVQGQIQTGKSGTEVLYLQLLPTPPLLSLPQGLSRQEPQRHQEEESGFFYPQQAFLLAGNCFRVLPGQPLAS